MKKSICVIAALLLSVASYAIWFHTSCGWSFEVDADQFETTQEVVDYMNWLEANYCPDPTVPSEPMEP